MIKIGVCNCGNNEIMFQHGENIFAIVNHIKNIGWYDEMDAQEIIYSGQQKTTNISLSDIKDLNHFNH